MLHVRDADFTPPREPIRRMSVFASPGKRRHFTAEEKARIVAESFASGESVCAVARRHGLMAAQLFAWRKNARLRGEAPTTKENLMQPLGLEIRAASVCDERSATQIAPIEIAIGAVIVRVPQGFDAATLRAVLQTLNATT
jgi:transposase